MICNYTWKSYNQQNSNQRHKFFIFSGVPHTEWGEGCEPHHETWTLKMWKTMQLSTKEFPMVSSIFSSSLWSTPATKKGPEASEVFPPATHHASKLANVYKSDACEVFRTSSKFTKYYACHKIWLPKPPLSSQAVKILKCFRITRKIHRSPRTPCETSFENGGHNFFRAFQRPPWINTAKVLQ